MLDQTGVLERHAVLPPRPRRSRWDFGPQPPSPFEGSKIGALRPLAPPLVEQPSEHASRTTRLLRAVVDGDADASEGLMPLFYDELHFLAERMMGRAGRGHTLQPTALIHEAWMRLVPVEEGWESQRHFLQFAAKAMRSVLIDHARAARREKRGGGRKRVTVEQDLLAEPAEPEDLLAVHDSLGRLAQLDEQLAQIVEMRVFGGLSHPEVARVLDTSLRTVERGWRTARAWLIKDMERDDGV